MGASWDGGVERETERRTCQDKATFGWVTDFWWQRREDEITVQVSSTCEEVGGDARVGLGNWIDACSGNKARREGNRAESGESRTGSSQGNGR